MTDISTMELLVLVCLPSWVTGNGFFTLLSLVFKGCLVDLPQVLQFIICSSYNLEKCKW